MFLLSTTRLHNHPALTRGRGWNTAPARSLPRAELLCSVLQITALVTRAPGGPSVAAQWFIAQLRLHALCVWGTELGYSLEGGPKSLECRSALGKPTAQTGE